MKYSLLYKNAETNQYNESGSAALTYDLSADKAAAEFCGSKQKAEYFLNVLRRPLTDIDNIRFRRDILADFRRSPKLLAELRQLLVHYDNIVSDWQSMRPSASHSGMQGGDPAVTEYAFSALSVAATYSKTVITYLRFIKELLEGAELESEGMLSIFERCRDMFASGALETVSGIAELFTDPSYEKYDFGLSVELDGSMRLGKSEIFDVAISEKKKKGLLSKIIPQKHGDGLELSYDSEEKNLILNRGIMSLYAALNGTAVELYELFYGISKELIFYECALKYEEFLSSRGATSCMAELLPGDADRIEIHGLTDLYLLLETGDPSKIVPWDIELGSDDSGMIIKGENSSGKTSFIRAIGTAQLFTQAGLPICARAASLSIRGAIFTQFSSAEKEFKEGDIAGRFEGEVRQIAEIVDCIVPHTLVLLNETFQTTVYEEGTEGIYNILKYFEKTGTKYLFVTRLLGLFGLMRDSGTVFAETYAGFRVRITER